MDSSGVKFFSEKNVSHIVRYAKNENRLFLLQSDVKKKKKKKAKTNHVCWCLHPQGNPLRGKGNMFFRFVSYKFSIQNKSIMVATLFSDCLRPVHTTFTLVKWQMFRPQMEARSELFQNTISHPLLCVLFKDMTPEAGCHINASDHISSRVIILMNR